MEKGQCSIYYGCIITPKLSALKLQPNLVFSHMAVGLHWTPPASFSSGFLTWLQTEGAYLLTWYHVSIWYHGWEDWSIWGSSDTFLYLLLVCPPGLSSTVALE